MVDNSKHGKTCIDAGGDYVERCIPQAHALKDCADAHPLYYSSVVDKDEEEEVAKKKSDVTPPPVTEQTPKDEKKIMLKLKRKCSMKSKRMQ